MIQSVYKSEAGMKKIREFTGKVMENWPVEHEQIEVTAGGYRTGIIGSGPADGAPIILLHGTGTNSASWMGDVTLLSERFRVYALDIPGEPGLSDERRISPNGGGPAAWLENLYEKLGLQSAHLIGMSLGGLYSILFGAASPERVRSLSLLAPSGLAGTKVSFIFKAIPLSMMGDWGLKRINRLVSPGVELPEVMFEYARLTARYFKPLMESLPILSDEELDRLTMPLLYFGGSRDALLKTAGAADRLRKHLPHAEVNVIEGGGHTILGKTAEIIRFIEEAERGKT